MPIPVGAQFTVADGARGLHVAAFHLQSALEDFRLRLHTDEKLGTAKTDAGRNRLGIAVGAWQKGDPLPEDTTAPALGDKALPITRLQRQLQDAGDALILFQVSHMNAAAEVQKFRPETDGRCG